jgi:hypothetical protein
LKNKKGPAFAGLFYFKEQRAKSKEQSSKSKAQSSKQKDQR